MKKIILIMLLGIILILPIVYAADYSQIISNSKDWQDVYSSMIYADFNNVNGDYLTSSDGTTILNVINKSNSIMIMSSVSNPYVSNYAEQVKAKGFSNVQEISSDNLNLQLIDNMKNINSFIIVDDNYGYRAISVAPYAVVSNSWVLLVNKNNINDVVTFLSKRNVNKLIVYGNIDDTLTKALTKYNPEIINNNDKFQDNIQIVKKYMETKPSKQIALTSGNFIEKELMIGVEPIVLVDKENAPAVTIDYLKSSGVIAAIQIGNDLVGAGKFVSRQTGIQVMVKFGKGSPNDIKGLDTFPVDVNHKKYTNYYNSSQDNVVCSQVGLRNNNKFCSIDSEWVNQKNSDATCENNFECSSNLCINSKCVSGSMWNSFIRWFSRLFGGK